jgi:large subunit ribosomal protein L25
MELKLIAEPRVAKGKGGARKTRAAGRVPGILYGHGSDPVSVSVDDRELSHALHTDAGQNVLLNLVLDGEEILAMPREVQRNLLRGKLVHVDFLRIARDEKIAVEVPIQLVGEAIGVREEGGVVQHQMWTLHVESFPQDVPGHIEADITKLGMGDSLKVADLVVAETLTILTDIDEVVVSIVAPQIVRTEAEEAAEAAEGEEGAEEGEAAGGEGGEAAQGGSGGSDSSEG